MSTEDENVDSEASEEVIEQSEEAELEEPETVEAELEEEAEKTEAEEKLADEEEEKKERIEKKKVKKPEPVGEEFFYTIPLRQTWVVRNIRTPKAVKHVRDYVMRHLKPEDVKIDETINNLIWKKGIEKPPAKIKVRVIKDKDGVAKVYPVKK